MITVKTDCEKSLVVGRNGIHKLAAIQIWRGNDGTMFIDGISRSGKTLNACFTIDKQAADKLVAKIKGKIRVDVRGGVAYCDDPCVEIVDHDNH